MSRLVLLIVGELLWDLPEEFATLRRVLESRTGRRGKREFVQVLRLFEHFSPGEVHAAVRDAHR